MLFSLFGFLVFLSYLFCDAARASFFFIFSSIFSAHSSSSFSSFRSSVSGIFIFFFCCSVVSPSHLAPTYFLSCRNDSRRRDKPNSNAKRKKSARDVKKRNGSNAKKPSEHSAKAALAAQAAQAQPTAESGEAVVQKIISQVQILATRNGAIPTSLLRNHP